MQDIGKNEKLSLLRWINRKTAELYNVDMKIKKL